MKVGDRRQLSSQRPHPLSSDAARREEWVGSGSRNQPVAHLPRVRPMIWASQSQGDGEGEGKEQNRALARVV